MKPTRACLLPVTLFAIAMGLLEAVVVIYLRELYYPGGFTFPLKEMCPALLSAELLRELATLIMLIAIGYISGYSRTTRFAWFIYSFAIWDIFYYVFLKLMLQWPESLFTWDILFLIPVTWVGPVLAPVINSVSMIVLATVLLRANKYDHHQLNRFEWLLLIVGSLVVVLSYTIDYASFLMNHFSLVEILTPSNSSKLMDYASTFVPARFNWILFMSGVLLHWMATVSVRLRIPVIQS